MMSPRSEMKRLQPQCQTQRSNEDQIRSPELPIFPKIKNQYGRELLNHARRWELFACRQSSTRAQLYFLHECLRQNILPNSVNYRPPLNHPTAWQIARGFGKQLIKLMITDAHNRMIKYQTNIDISKGACENTIDASAFAELNGAIQRRVNNMLKRRKEELMDKLTKLARSEEIPSNSTWVKNISQRQLSNEEHDVLVRGMNFNLGDAPKRHYLADLEYALKSTGINEEDQQTIRQTIIPNVARNRPMQALSVSEKKALRSLQEDENIIILPADKGRTTVVMDKPDYIEKAKILLNDTTTYRIQETDPTAKLIKEINKLLKALQSKSELTKEECKKMRPDESNIAQFYGLPKIHKAGIPLRPIVSLPGTPTYNLSKELWKRLKPPICNSDHSINYERLFLE